MNDPIVFVSRNRLREDMLDDFRKHYRESVPATQAGKPGTLLQLAYTSLETSEVAIIRLFPDPQALDAQLQGADQRSKAAYKFIEPASMEIYGAPGPSTVEIMKRIAGSGVPVSLNPLYLGGFIRVHSS
jgi:hypothetical protein